MYSLITMEDTIRIPAEYIRKDRKLEDHIDELAHAAFEGRFDEDEHYTLLTFGHETVGRGKLSMVMVQFTSVFDSRRYISRWKPMKS